MRLEPFIFRLPTFIYRPCFTGNLAGQGFTGEIVSEKNRENVQGNRDRDTAAKLLQERGAGLPFPVPPNLDVGDGDLLVSLGATPTRNKENARPTPSPSTKAEREKKMVEQGDAIQAHIKSVCDLMRDTAVKHINCKYSTADFGLLLDLVNKEQVKIIFKSSRMN